MKTVRDKLYHFEETPPPEIWDKLSGKIGDGKVITMQTRKRTKLVAFMTAAAAIVTLLLINFVFLQKHENTTPAQIASHPISGDSSEQNNELLEAIIKAPENKKLIASRNAISDGFKKYFTIEGPEGEPVKISPKAATLIISADNEYPPKPVWDKKIDEWQHIMLTNSLAPTSANLLDIIQEASKNVE